MAKKIGFYVSLKNNIQSASLNETYGKKIARKTERKKTRMQKKKKRTYRKLNLHSYDNITEMTKVRVAYSYF